MQLCEACESLHLKPRRTIGPHCPSDCVLSSFGNAGLVTHGFIGMVAHTFL